VGEASVDMSTMPQKNREPPDPAAARQIGLTLERHGEAWVLVVVGEVDTFTAPLLDHDLVEALAERPSLLVVDLSEVEFFGSAGLAVLLDAQQRFGSDTALRVVARRTVLRPIQLTGMDTVLSVHPARMR
jgi:anti-sigma B factor antagonist